MSSTLRPKRPHDMSSTLPCDPGARSQVDESDKQQHAWIGKSYMRCIDCGCLVMASGWVALWVPWHMPECAATKGTFCGGLDRRGLPLRRRARPPSSLHSTGGAERPAVFKRSPDSLAPPSLFHNRTSLWTPRPLPAPAHPSLSCTFGIVSSSTLSPRWRPATTSPRRTCAGLRSRRLCLRRRDLSVRARQLSPVGESCPCLTA